MAEAIDFKEFVLQRVIDESAHTKFITFQGKYKGETAVIRLEKTPFKEEDARKAVNDPRLEAHRNLNNDVYSRYMFTPFSNDVNGLKAIVVCPANETVLAKYSRSKTILFYESPKIYDDLVEPFITKMVTQGKDYNQWVFNILDGKTEREHVLMNDPDPDKGFMLLPSLKSSGDEKEIHYIALCHRRDIRSLRDLNENHLPLLENIMQKCYRSIDEKCSHLEGQLRAYIHYHPTFYHFHVHFELVNPCEYKSSDRDNLLTVVIDNIKINSLYYRKRTLVFPLAVESPLWKHISTNIEGSPYPMPFLDRQLPRDSFNESVHGD